MLAAGPKDRERPDRRREAFLARVQAGCSCAAEGSLWPSLAIANDQPQDAAGKAEASGPVAQDGRMRLRARPQLKAIEGAPVAQDSPLPTIGFSRTMPGYSARILFQAWRAPSGNRRCRCALAGPSHLRPGLPATRDKDRPHWELAPRRLYGGGGSKGRPWAEARSRFAESVRRVPPQTPSGPRAALDEPHAAAPRPLDVVAAGSPKQRPAHPCRLEHRGERHSGTPPDKKRPQEGANRRQSSRQPPQSCYGLAAVGYRAATAGAQAPGRTRERAMEASSSPILS
jgi:hypothetical protein